MKRQTIVLCSILIVYSVIFFSFFAQGLPRFWSDDIYYYKIAEQTSYSGILKQIADFTQKKEFYRVTSILISKIHLDMFSENLYLYRLIKMLCIALTLCMSSYFLMDVGIRKRIILSTSLLYITSPVAFISALWICTTGHWSLLGKVLSFLLFYNLYRTQHIGIKYIFLSLFFILSMFAWIGTREDFIITPFVVLTFLLLKRTKTYSLYLLIFGAIIIVLPYNIFGAGSSGMTAYFHISNISMFNVWLGQIYMLLPFIGYAIYLNARRKDFVISDLMLLSIIWLAFEIVMVFIYPSNEMRYLEALLFSSLFFVTIFIGSAFNNLSKRTLAVTCLLLMLITGYKVFENIRWDYYFRGHLGSSFVAIDNQINYINANFRNSLCVYKNSTMLYYDWKTTNHYININENNAANAKFTEYYRWVPIGDKLSLDIIEPEKYEYIIFLGGLAKNYEFGLSNIKYMDGVRDTVFDSSQKYFNFVIYKTSLYDTNLNEMFNYPAKATMLPVESKKFSPDNAESVPFKKL